jgi:hypothetical protein
MASDIDRPKRLVTLRPDGDDFVVTLYPPLCFATLSPAPFERWAADFVGKLSATVPARMTERSLSSES